MSTPVRSVALVLLVLLAGCGLPSSEAPTSVATDTALTPAPVPNATSVGGRLLAPGVTKAGVVDPAELAAAHRRHYANRSYRRETVTEHVFPNGSVDRLENETRLYDATNRTVLLRIRESDPRVNLPTVTRERWSNGSLAVERTRYDDGSTIYATRRGGGLTLDDHGESVAFLLAEQDATVVGQRPSNGTMEYVLAVDDPTGLGPGENGRLVAVVTADGYVRVISYAADRDLGEVTVTYRIRQTYTPLPRGVGRPPWLDEALDGSDGAER